MLQLKADLHGGLICAQGELKTVSTLRQGQRSFGFDSGETDFKKDGSVNRENHWQAF
jgi:hypothetical protein